MYSRLCTLALYSQFCALYSRLSAIAALCLPYYALDSILWTLYSRICTLDSVLSVSRHCTSSPSTVRHSGGETGTAVGRWRWGRRSGTHCTDRQRYSIRETTIKNARMANASGSVTESKELAACSEGETLNSFVCVRAGGR